MTEPEPVMKYELCCNEVSYKLVELEIDHHQNLIMVRHMKKYNHSSIKPLVSLSETERQFSSLKDIYSQNSLLQVIPILMWIVDINEHVVAQKN